MTTSVKKVIVMLLLVIIYTSCTQKPTLQAYYVDNELKPGFTVLDIPTNFLAPENTNFTAEEQEAYESIDKLNVLAFIVNEHNKNEYKSELTKLKTIINAPKYKELMRGGNSTYGKITVKFTGDIERLDELILFGNSNEKGFAIIRVLGDDINANKLLNLIMVLDKNSVSNPQVNRFINLFK